MITLRDLDFIIPPDQHCWIVDVTKGSDFVSIHDGKWILGNFHSRLYEVIDILAYKDQIYIGVKKAKI